MKKAHAMWRVIFWPVVGIVFTLAFDRLKWAFDHELIGGLFGLKLAFLGIIFALGAFQHQLVWGIARIYEARLFESERHRGQAQTPLEVERLETYQREVRHFMQEGVLPHNETLLWNILSIILMLLLSSIADIAILLLPVDTGWLRTTSTGFFIAIFLPIVENFYRYLRSLRFEFQALRDMFRG